MSKRPDITTVLDVRSDETIMVIADPASTFRYDPTWLRPLSFDDIHVDSKTVVVVDRLTLYKASIESILAAGPRIVAFAPADIEQHKAIRKALRQLHPWSEVWELSCDFGRLLVTTAFGRSYDRDQVRDDRPQAAA